MSPRCISHHRPWPTARSRRHGQRWHGTQRESLLHPCPSMHLKLRHLQKSFPHEKLFRKICTCDSEPRGQEREETRWSLSRAPGGGFSEQQQGRPPRFHEEGEGLRPTAAELSQAQPRELQTMPCECLAINVNKERNQLGRVLSLPLPAAAAVPSAARSVSASRPAAAFYTPLAPAAAAPEAAVVSEEPQSAPCSPAAAAGNRAAEWTPQARSQWSCGRKGRSGWPLPPRSGSTSGRPNPPPNKSSAVITHTVQWYLLTCFHTSHKYRKTLAWVHLS